MTAKIHHLTIKVMSVIPAELKKQVDTLDRECFSWAYSLSPDKKVEFKDRFCSKNDRIKTILALENDILIGIIGAMRREINYEGKQILLGGIGGLCTRPDRRQMGVATRLLAKVMKELKKAGCDIVYLCTSIDKPWMVKFYGKVGFVPLGRPHTYFGKSGKHYTDEDAMIAPVNSVEKFQFVIKQQVPFDIGVGNW